MDKLLKCTIKEMAVGPVHGLIRFIREHPVEFVLATNWIVLGALVGLFVFYPTTNGHAMIGRLALGPISSCIASIIAGMTLVALVEMMLAASCVLCYFVAEDTWNLLKGVDLTFIKSCLVPFMLVAQAYVLGWGVTAIALWMTQTGYSTRAFIVGTLLIGLFGMILVGATELLVYQLGHDWYAGARNACIERYHKLEGKQPLK